MMRRPGTPKPSKKPKNNKLVVDKKKWRDLTKKTRKKGSR